MATIRMIFAEEHAGFQPITGPVELTLRAFFPIPKSTAKKLLPAMEAERVFYAHRPDWTNIAKLAEDSLTGLAWKDDAQVVKIGGESGKWYSRLPRLEIIVRALE
jgi:Holliday junction resolvase RusA-like endonuclease